MSRVFILSDFYSAQLISQCLDYISDIAVSEIILLQETHRKSSFIWGELPFKLSIINELEDCVYNSDVVLVLNNAGISKDSVVYIKTLTNKYNKLLYEIQTPDFIMDAMLKNTSFDPYLQLPSTSTLTNCSNILLINIGAMSLCTNIEIMLRRILVNCGASIYQFFSRHTLTILEQMEINNIINKKHLKQYNTPILHNNDISIIAIDIGYNIRNIGRYSQYIKELSPDFIIVVASGMNDTTEIRNYVKYNLEQNIDIILFSPFHIVDNKHIINITSLVELNKHEFFITDVGVVGEITRYLLEKLTFPNGIYLCC